MDIIKKYNDFVKHDILGIGDRKPLSKKEKKKRKKKRRLNKKH